MLHYTNGSTQHLMCSLEKRAAHLERSYNTPTATKADKEKLLSTRTTPINQQLVQQSRTH